MLTLLLKVAVTAAFIVGLSELGKRVPGVAGLIVALPLATAMTMVLMHIDGEGTAKVSAFAWAALIYAPPSFVFLGAVLAGLWLRIGFWPALIGAVMVTAAGFAGYLYLLSKAGITPPA